MLQVIQVTDKNTVEAFHHLTEKIYKNDPNQIPPLRLMVENVFNPLKNARFKIGDACRWIAMNDGECVGRIAAFYDSDYSNGYDQSTGCFGFFECIDDEETAFLLFDTAKNWLAGNGMEAMDGPVNFGENFFNWGLLVENFQSPAFGMTYNPPYYRRLFESYGFRTYYEQYSYTLDITNPDLPDRFWRIAERVTQRPGYTFEHFLFRKRKKYISDFIEIHQQAWESHGNYKPVNEADLMDMIKESGFFLDEEFVWFVYHEGRPIGFFMMIPDLNQVIQKLK
ncbi:MAG: N-acetyltransferase, partial [Draconibacterium sp.]